jgi:hypothetical protein
MLHKAAMLQGSTFDQKVELSSLARELFAAPPLSWLLLVLVCVCVSISISISVFLACWLYVARVSVKCAVRSGDGMRGNFIIKSTEDFSRVSLCLRNYGVSASLRLRLTGTVCVCLKCA